MANNKQKVCVSKKYTYIGLFVLVGFLLVFLNYSFLQTKLTTNSRAAVKSKKKLANNTRAKALPLPDPGMLTSDPKKILPYWLNVELAEAGKTVESSRGDYSNDSKLNSVYSGIKEYYKNEKGFTENVDYSFIGQLDLPYFNTLNCVIGDAVNVTPLTYIFSELSYTSGNPKRFEGINSEPLTLSFFKHTKTREIDAFLTGYSKQNSPTPYMNAQKYIPYKSFLEAFSHVLKIQGYPLTNSEAGKTRADAACDDMFNNTEHIWKKWSNHIVNSDKIRDAMNPSSKDLAGDPEPTPSSIFQTKINRFTSAFEDIIGSYIMPRTKATFLPEVAIGPLQETDVWGRTHITYFLEGGKVAQGERPDKHINIWDQVESYGNYSKLLLLLSYFTTDNPDHLSSVGINNAFAPMLTPVPTDTPQEMYKRDVYVDKTFINYIYNHCKIDKFEPTSKSKNPNFICPKLSIVDEGLINNSLILKEYQQGAFLLHFKSLSEEKKSNLQKLLGSIPEDRLSTVVITVGLGN